MSSAAQVFDADLIPDLGESRLGKLRARSRRSTAVSAIEAPATGEREALDPAEAARELYDLGFSVVPPAEDGTKRPFVSWKAYQTSRCSPEQLDAWYAKGRAGVGFLTGAASRVRQDGADVVPVEMLELEGRAVSAGVLDRLEAACAAEGVGHVLARLRTGWEERTPSGGIHWYYGCPEVSGARKLAKDGAGKELIETKGEGGYAICAPSSGRVHPSGAPWERVTGGPTTMPILTPDERNALHDVARSLDAKPAAPRFDRDLIPDSGESGARSGSGWLDQVVADFNARTTWDEVLAGVFERHHRQGQVDHWHFVGQDNATGATTNANGTDRLIVFSGTAAGQGWETSDGSGPAHSYDRFSAHVLIATGRDDATTRTEVARELRKTGSAPPVARSASSVERTRATPTAPTAEDAGGPDPDIWQFLDTPEPEYDWVVPGLLDRGDRLIVTAAEGDGKSTLLRQFGVQVGAGIHPFTLDDIEPMRVLFIDLENSERQTRNKLLLLAETAGRERLARGQFVPLVRAEGLDLLNASDREWLRERVRANKPDLLIVGPLYKMASGDPTTEEAAREVTMCLDELRAECPCAMVIEAHTPHASVGGRRPKRPYGASLWLRWPEFGLHLDGAGVLTHWRNPRDERAFPPALQRGDEWPWELADGRATTWAQMVALCRDHGEILSYRDIAAELGTNKTQVGRAVKANEAEWKRLEVELSGLPTR